MFPRTQQCRSSCAMAALLVLASGSVHAAPKASGKSAWTTTTVGTVTIKGSATTSPSGRITVSGEGTDIWSTADGFQFLYKVLSRDGQITANLTGFQNTDGWAKAGLMIRQGLMPNAVHASLLATPSNGIVFERRIT